MAERGASLRRLDRIDRLDLLARVLRDRPGTTAADVARELGVSVRSVFRDIEHLRERGYPIDAARGRGGGLRLHGSWGLGKVLLTSEEALCSLLALAIAEKLEFPMFSSEVARARKKIVDAFPAAERRRIAPLRERVFIGEPASRAVRASYGEPAVAATRRLQSAFVEERVVIAEYVKESGEQMSRRLEPHALVVSWPAWYLLALDHLRGAPRTFRFDRFRSVEPQPQTFRSRPREIARELLDAAGVPLRHI